MKRTKTKKLDSAKRMPPLRHSAPGNGFDPNESEVFAWFRRQPDMMQYLFDKAKEWGFIAYDAQAGTWQGVDYDR